MNRIKRHARIAWNPFFTRVLPNYSSYYRDYTMMVSRITPTNQDRDICLCVGDVDCDNPYIITCVNNENNF